MYLGEEPFRWKQRSVQNSYSEGNPDVDSKGGSKAGAGRGGGVAGMGSGVVREREY